MATENSMKRGPGQPPIGPLVRACVTEAQLAHIEAMRISGEARTTSDAVRILIGRALGEMTRRELLNWIAEVIGDFEIAGQSSDGAPGEMLSKILCWDLAGQHSAVQRWYQRGLDNLRAVGDAEALVLVEKAQRLCRLRFMSSVIEDRLVGVGASLETRRKLCGELERLDWEMRDVLESV